MGGVRSEGWFLFVFLISFTSDPNVYQGLRTGNLEASLGALAAESEEGMK